MHPSALDDATQVAFYDTAELFEQLADRDEQVGALVVSLLVATTIYVVGMSIYGFASSLAGILQFDLGHFARKTAELIQKSFNRRLSLTCGLDQLAMVL